jgi:hypothetical protein
LDTLHGAGAIEDEADVCFALGNHWYTPDTGAAARMCRAAAESVYLGSRRSRVNRSLTRLVGRFEFSAALFDQSLIAATARIAANTSPQRIRWRPGRQITVRTVLNSVLNSHELRSSSARTDRNVRMPFPCGMARSSHKQEH